MPSVTSGGSTLTNDANARPGNTYVHSRPVVIVRPVASVEELIQAEHVIADQLPPRYSSRAHGLTTPRQRFELDRSLMLVAEQDGTIVGAALAFRTDDAVKIDAIALKPEARRRGVGRKLVEEIEAEAIRLGAVAIYAGGATAENRGFYWRVGFRGRKSLMQKALPLGNRLTLERRRRASLERRSGF